MCKLSFLLLLFFLLLCPLSLCDQFEYILYRDLMRNYDPLERPIQNFSQPVTVKMKITVSQIIGLDERNQVLESMVMMQYEWLDYKLRWTPEEYNGVTDVRFPYGTVWTPDVLLYNSVDSEIDTTYKSKVIAYSDGTMNWMPPAILKSSCKVDITWFPFDEQSCLLKFGSWTYNGYGLDLSPNYVNDSNINSAVDTSEYLENGEWILVGTPAYYHVKKFTCCPEPYTYAKFYLRLRRRTLYYGFNLIIPSLLISLMTVLGFTLPPDAGEKITLEITILLSVCFFLTYLSDMSPPTSEAVPLIGTFFSCCMLVVSASVVFTVVVLNLHYRTPDTHEMTPLVRSVLLNWLPWMLMMRRPGVKFSFEENMDSEQSEPKSDSHSRQCSVQPSVASRRADLHAMASALTESESLLRTVHHIDPVAGRHSLEPQCPMCSHSRDQSLAALLSLLGQIEAELGYIMRRMEKEDEDDEERNDWKFAAMVVDRLCLILFSAFICASTCGIMFSAPHLSA